MDSSSEDSFAWTSASSNKSESGAMLKEESDSDKRYKRKLQKELFQQNGDHNDLESDEPRVKKRKKIKREPSSSPLPAALANGHAAAERDLALRVKQEREREQEQERERDQERERAQRRKRPRSTETPAPSDRDSADRPDTPPRKKKKKRKRETSDTEHVLVDKFEAEEARVEPRPPPRGPAGDARGKPYTSREFVDDDHSSGDDRPAPAAPPSAKERITFEEESDERPESGPEREPEPGRARGGRLARYLRGRPALRPEPAPRAAAAAPGPDDDVWLLHAPRGLATPELAGAALTLGARCKLRAAGRGYEALPEPAPARGALLQARGAGWRLRGVALRGAMRLRERVPRARAPVAAPASPPRALPLPAARRRHPLLGADYERALAAAPAPRRARAAGADERREKKTKKKRERAPPAAAWDSERGIEESLFRF